eukprot:1147103-Amphidinium_carterae.1
MRRRGWNAQVFYSSTPLAKDFFRGGWSPLLLVTLDPAQSVNFRVFQTVLPGDQWPTSIKMSLLILPIAERHA